MKKKINSIIELLENISVLIPNDNEIEPWVEDTINSTFTEINQVHQYLNDEISNTPASDVYYDED